MARRKYSRSGSVRTRAKRVASATTNPLGGISSSLLSIETLQSLSYAQTLNKLGYKKTQVIDPMSGSVVKTTPVKSTAAKVVKAKTFKQKEEKVKSRGNTCKARPDGRKPSSKGAGKSRDFVPYCERKKK